MLSPSSTSPWILSLLIFELLNKRTIVLENNPIPKKKIRNTNNAIQSNFNDHFQLSGLILLIKSNLKRMKIVEIHKTKPTAIDHIFSVVLLMIRLNLESGISSGFT
ncbi:hypothetical protein D3C86_1457460 [compost metagenome]